MEKLGKASFEAKVSTTPSATKCLEMQCTRISFEISAMLLPLSSTSAGARTTPLPLQHGNPQGSQGMHGNSRRCPASSCISFCHHRSMTL